MSAERSAVDRCGKPCEAPFADMKDRCYALRVGASVLHSRWPVVQAPCIVWIGINQLEAHAVVLWPGVVRVTARHSGELIVQSMPGQPQTPDWTAT